MGLEDFVIEGSRLGFAELCRAVGAQLFDQTGWLSVPAMLVFTTASSTVRPTVSIITPGFSPYIQSADAISRSLFARLKATVEISLVNRQADRQTLDLREDESQPNVTELGSKPSDSSE